MGQKRVLLGTVVSDKMDKTVVVSVARRKKHKLYRKVVSATKHYKAHDDTNRCRIGDQVRIIEARPMSRTKRWRVYQVLTQGDVAEIQPDTIGRELEAQTQLAAKHEEAEHEDNGAGETVADEEPAAEDGDEENRE